MRHSHLALVAILAWPAAAAAQEVPGRYQIAPVSGGVVRLDTVTGAMTLCRDEDGELLCDRTGPEADEDALAQLEARVDALEKALGAAKTTKKQLSTPLPDTAEIDQALTIMEKIMRRFMGLAEEWSRELPKSEPYPNKT